MQVRVPPFLLNIIATQGVPRWKERGKPRQEPGQASSRAFPRKERPACSPRGGAGLRLVGEFVRFGVVL